MKDVSVLPVNGTYGRETNSIVLTWNVSITIMAAMNGDFTVFLGPLGAIPVIAFHKVEYINQCFP